jgi:hypothetical protein
MIAIFGNDIYGADALTFTVVANNVQESRDSSFATYASGRSVFFVGGATIGTSVDIPELRKNEFRELILTLKPAHTVAVLFINYI